jgi:hypothetical protein
MGKAYLFTGDSIIANPNYRPSDNEDPMQQYKANSDYNILRAASTDPDPTVRAKALELMYGKDKK